MPNTKIPGPKGSFFTGHLKEARERPLEFALELTRSYGDVSQIRIGPFPMVVLNHPEHIERVLRTEKKKYGKPAMVQMMRDLVGDGLLFSEGDRWLRQRRILQPVFHRARIAAFGVVMAEAITRRIEAWRALPEGQPLNLTEEAARLIFEVVGRCLFSCDLGGEAKELGEAIQFTLRWLDDRSQNPVAVPLFIPTQDNRRFRAAQRLFKETTASMIAERRQKEAAGEPLPSDLLSMLLEARDAETGEGMSDQELHDELFVFLVAGYETTAAALEWTMMLLAQHPEEQDAIFEEHRIVCGKHAPRSNQIRDLVRARQVIDESLRLYPPAFGLTRQAVEEDEVGGYRIKKGTQVLLSTYAMHRHPGFWEEPDRFDPDRFSEARSEGRPRYAYFPFGGGQRICIGQAFASMELAIFVPTMCSAFRFALAEEADCTPQPRMTLRPRGPMWMLLTPR